VFAPVPPFGTLTGLEIAAVDTQVAEPEVVD
jgi:hypothetical protein